LFYLEKIFKGAAYQDARENIWNYARGSRGTLIKITKRKLHILCSSPNIITEKQPTQKNALSLVHEPNVQC